MYSDLFRLTKLEPEELDLFLERGWFRLSRNLFTTSFLTFKDTLYDAFWLRVLLEPFTFSKSQKNLLNRAAKFKVEVGPFVFTEEKKELFLKYRQSVAFEPSSSLQNILNSESEESTAFNTFNVCIYDEQKLIACGILDLGLKSAQGIVSFFDPDYKKYSLGKVLVLHKIMYCKSLNMSYFYPGYVVPGYARFDYKLDISKEYSEYFDLKFHRWFDIQYLNVDDQPLTTMVTALKSLEVTLKSFGFEEFRFKKYKFYDINLDDKYSYYNLLTYPCFIHCFSNSKLEEVIIVYDIFEEEYKLLICHKIFQLTIPYDEDYFSEYLIRENVTILKEKSQLNFAFALNQLLTRNANYTRN